MDRNYIISKLIQKIPHFLKSKVVVLPFWAAKKNFFFFKAILFTAVSLSTLTSACLVSVTGPHLPYTSAITDDRQKRPQIFLQRAIQFPLQFLEEDRMKGYITYATDSYKLLLVFYTFPCKTRFWITDFFLLDFY